MFFVIYTGSYRLAYCFYVVCFVTSVVMSIALLAGGAVGSVCGEKRNFSEIMSKKSFQNCLINIVQ